MMNRGGSGSVKRSGKSFLSGGSASVALVSPLGSEVTFLRAVEEGQDRSRWIGSERGTYGDRIVGRPENRTR